MGCEHSHETKTNKQINKQITKDKRSFREEVKLLLLGPGESGKSTIFKQMKIIQDNGGYDEEERKTFNFIVFANIMGQMKVLVKAAEKLNIPLDEANQLVARRFFDLPNGGHAWTEEIGGMVKALWADSGIRQTYAMRDTYYQLNDSASYFFQHIERISKPGYIPSEQDVLRARVRTTGIQEAEFQLGTFKFRLVDVGGQRCERRKWIHCFEGEDVITSVIFCVAMSAYDQTLREENSQNRMKESLLLFDEVCNSTWFKGTPFILFLNKVDLFKEKIESVDLTTCFPNYTGGNDFDNASQFIKAAFLELNQTHSIYTHFTCAISTQNILFVFQVVKETVIQKFLTQTGLLTGI